MTGEEERGKKWVKEHSECECYTVLIARGYRWCPSCDEREKIGSEKRSLIDKLFSFSNND